VKTSLVGAVARNVCREMNGWVNKIPRCAFTAPTVGDAVGMAYLIDHELLQRLVSLLESPGKH
jgi:hypothetical protein